MSARGRAQVSAAFGLVEFVAAAAILEDRRGEFLERRLIDNSRLGGLDILFEFGEPGVEVRLVLPDRRQRRGAAAGLAVVGEQSRRFRRPFVESFSDSFTAARSKGAFPFDMSNSFFAASPSCFISARRSAIGSVSANTAPTPQANAIATITERFMSLSPHTPR